jgi:hypothetical protein
LTGESENKSPAVGGVAELWCKLGVRTTAYAVPDVRFTGDDEA